MKARYEVLLKADQLHEAAKFAVGARRRKEWIVEITFDAAQGALMIEDAVYGSKGSGIPASGTWPDRVQVEGIRLREITRRLPRQTVNVIALDDRICLIMNKLTVSLRRCDRPGRPAVGKRSLPRQPAPEFQFPARASGRYEPNDTWWFSARVPFPQHRAKKDGT